MWQTDGGAKQSTHRGGPSLTEDKPSVSANAVWLIYTSSLIKLTTNSSNNEEEDKKTKEVPALRKVQIVKLPALHKKTENDEKKSLFYLKN